MNDIRSLASRCKKGNNLLIAMMFFVGFSATVIASETADRERVFEEAKGLLRDGKAQDAFDLLSRYEVDWAGSDAYDYLLGVAALDSRNANDAIFSLQRLVIRRPAFSGARLELARAYYDAGEIELARLEFGRILKDDPPDRVRETVDSYMEAIKVKARAYTASTQYYIDFGGGYDTNAPAATDDNQFLTFTLAPNNLEKSSAFGQVAAGIVWNKPVTPQSRIMLTGNIMHRSNPSAHYVDPSVAAVGGAWVWNRGAHSANLGASATISLLDRSANKENYAVNGSYGYKFNKSWRFNSFLRYGALRFDGALDVQDVDQLMYGLGFEQLSKKSLLSVGLIGTKDDEVNQDSKFGNDGYGIQISDTWYFDDGSRIFVNFSASTTDYNEQFFTLDREDDIYSFTVGKSWARLPTKDWMLTGQINYSQKNSTVDLYQFDRWEIGIFLRRTYN